MRDDNGDMPADFDNEIHKWSLECKYVLTHPMVFLAKLIFIDTIVELLM